jgi:hypothetical protein
MLGERNPSNYILDYGGLSENHLPQNSMESLLDSHHFSYLQMAIDWSPHVQTHSNG